MDLSVRRGRLILAVDESDMSTITVSFPVMPANQIFLGGTVNLTSVDFFLEHCFSKLRSREFYGSVKQNQEDLVALQWWTKQINVVFDTSLNGFHTNFNNSNIKKHINNVSVDLMFFICGRLREKKSSRFTINYCTHLNNLY